MKKSHRTTPTVSTAGRSRTVHLELNFTIAAEARNAIMAIQQQIEIAALAARALALDSDGDGDALALAAHIAALRAAYADSNLGDVAVAIDDAIEQQVAIERTAVGGVQ